MPHLRHFLYGKAGVLRKFFSYKSVRYKIFFVYLPIEKYGYTKRPFYSKFLALKTRKEQIL